MTVNNESRAESVQETAESKVSMAAPHGYVERLAELAGGGVKQGYIHGTSDALGGEVDTDGVTVADLATTVYHQIGITADKELMAPGNRPIEIVDGGTVLDSLLAKKA